MGSRWNLEKTIQEVLKVKDYLRIDRFPTRAEMQYARQDSTLINAIDSNGGSKYIADKLGLELKHGETGLGKCFEIKAENILKSKGYLVENTSARFPYDLLINKTVKIDVKVSRLYKGSAGSFYSFNLETPQPRCDIFIAFAINDDMEIVKTYIIPAFALYGKTQLSVGETASRYDNYLDRYDIIEGLAKTIRTWLFKIGI